MSSSESEGDDQEVLEFEPDPANVHVHWEKKCKIHHFIDSPDELQVVSPRYEQGREHYPVRYNLEIEV